MRKKNNLEKKNRVKRVYILLTEEEDALLMRAFKASLFSKKANFLRSKLFNQALIFEVQLQYEALLTSGEMITQLTKIDANFNQLIKGINTYKSTNLITEEKANIMETSLAVKDLIKIFDGIFIPNESLKTTKRKSTLEKSNRIKRIDIRLTEEEDNLLNEEFKASPFNKKTVFLRSKLFNRILAPEVRLQYEALLKAGKMNTKLIAVGSNFNQVVKGINMYKNTKLTVREKTNIMETSLVVKDLINIFNSILLD